MSITEPHRYIIWTVREAKLVEESVWDSRREVPLSRERAIDVARGYLRAHGEPKPATPLHDFEEDLFNERMRAVEAAKQRLFSEDK